jgi:hypothetical protein
MRRSTVIGIGRPLFWWHFGQGVQANGFVTEGAHTAISRTRMRAEPPVPARRRAAVACLSIVELLASFITTSDHNLWPVRMVARELLPAFVLVNVIGGTLAYFFVSRALPIFFVGLAVGIWPLAHIVTVKRDIARQWHAQGLGAQHLRLAGILDVMPYAAIGRTLDRPGATPS